MMGEVMPSGPLVKRARYAGGMSNCSFRGSVVWAEEVLGSSCPSNAGYAMVTKLGGSCSVRMDTEGVLGVEVLEGAGC